MLQSTPTVATRLWVERRKTESKLFNDDIALALGSYYTLRYMHLGVVNPVATLGGLATNHTARPWKEDVYIYTPIDIGRGD